MQILYCTIHMWGKTEERSSFLLYPILINTCSGLKLNILMSSSDDMHRAFSVLFDAPTFYASFYVCHFFVLSIVSCIFGTWHPQTHIKYWHVCHVCNKQDEAVELLRAQVLEQQLGRADARLSSQQTGTVTFIHWQVLSIVANGNQWNFHES